MRRLAALTALAVALTAAAGGAHAEPRSETTAKALSGVGTGASAALFLSAFLVSQHEGDVHLPLLYAGLGSSIITPALGHFYVGDYLTVGMAIRAGAAVLSAYAVSEYTQQVRCPTVEFDVSCKSLKGEAIALLGVAAIAFVGGAAYDFKQLPDAVGSYNRRHTFTVAPTMIPTSGPPGAGLVLAGTW